MVFNYVIRPGTEKWEELNSKEEKFKVCQIPEDVLENITTEDLLNSVLNYPLLYDVFAYNDLHQGIEYLEKNFNGLNELFKRKELTRMLIDFYSKEKIVEDEEKKFKIIFLEILITYPKIYKELSKAEKIELENISILKKRDKEKINFFSRYFLNIYENLTTHVQMKKTSVKTPKGSNVEVYTDLEELSNYERDTLDKKCIKLYPRATFKASSTTRYNCHSYAWYSQDIKKINIGWILQNSI